MSWRENLIEQPSEIHDLIRQTRRIAVLGIKTESQADQPAFYVPKYLVTAGFEVIPVPVYYPEVIEILGARVYRRLTEIPGSIDLVNVFGRPHEHRLSKSRALSMPTRGRLRGGAGLLDNGFFKAGGIRQRRGTLANTARRGAVADATRRAEPPMALSDSDHIEALRKRLLTAEQDKERELAEIREMIRVLNTAPKLLSGMKLPLARPGVSEPVEHKTRTLSNRNVTTLVRNWLSEFRRMDEAMSIKEIVTYLKENGVTGKDRSLYSAVHVILKKEADASLESPNPPWVRYKAGVGFYKTLNDPDPLVTQR